MNQSISEYLLSCCEQYGFLGIAVADGHGMMLAQEGEGMGDAFLAHLPVWLEAGDHVCKLGGLGGALCSCVLPANRSSLMLAWQIAQPNGEKLFFAVLSRALPPRLGAVLEGIATTVCQYIEQATTVKRTS